MVGKKGGIQMKKCIGLRTIYFLYKKIILILSIYQLSNQFFLEYYLEYLFLFLYEMVLLRISFHLHYAKKRDCPFDDPHNTRYVLVLL
jgi:hypothetical protein